MEVLRQVGDPFAAGDADKAAFKDRQHAERDDDRRNPQIGDDRALRRHDRDANDERREPGHDDRRARDRERAADRRQHADERADGNIDVAGDDDHRHADGRDRDIGVAEQDVGKIARGEEARIDEADNDGERDDRDREQKLLAGQDGETARCRAFEELVIAVALTPPAPRSASRPSSAPTASDVACGARHWRRGHGGSGHDDGLSEDPGDRRHARHAVDT